MTELLWASIAVYGFVPLVFGWPFRRVQGKLWELAALVGVWFLLAVVLVATIAVEGMPEWTFDVGTIGSAVFGLLLGVLWAIRLLEWIEAEGGR